MSDKVAAKTNNSVHYERPMMLVLEPEPRTTSVQCNARQSGHQRWVYVAYADTTTRANISAAAGTLTHEST